MEREVVKRMLELATSAFGLVAALAWNGAITELFKRIFGETSGIVGLFIYAIIVTFIAVMVMQKLSRLSQELEKKEKEKNQPQ